MAYDIFNKYNFDKIDDKKSLNESYDCKWKLVSTKQVLDSDGFLTDYTWYQCNGKHIFIFGDIDMYGPEPDYADHECDSYREAKEWFEDYNGFAEDDDLEDQYHGFFAPDEDY